MASHEIGFVTVYEGSIVSMDLSKLYDKIAIIVDTSDGCFYKVGEPELVKPYYHTMIERFAAIDPSYADTITYIEFNPKTGDHNLDQYLKAELSKDEICTLINYFQNSIGEERMNEILRMDAATLHTKLEKLANIGF